MKISSPRLALLLALLAVSSATLSQAAPPFDKILPRTTLAYISLPDAPATIDRFDKTLIGKLAHDPAMDPFLTDLKSDLEARWSKKNGPLNMNWDNLRDAMAGEAALAITRSPSGGASEMVLFDIGKNQALARKVLADLEAALKAHTARRTTQQVAGATVVVIEMTKPAAAAPPKAVKGKAVAAAAPDVVVYFLKDDLLAFGTDLKAISEVLGLLAKPQDSLSTLPSFEATMKRCARDAGELKPHARWFVRPLELAEAVRADLPKPKGDDAVDMLMVLKKQGFQQIQGIGGFHNFVQDEYDIIYRAAIYAPGPRKLGTQMLIFPNSMEHKPEPWVPSDIATYIHFNWDLHTAFDAFGGVVETVVDEEPGWFHDLIEEIATDENGGGIHIQKDLVAHLGSQVTVITDHTLPITANSRRTLAAIVAKDPAALAANITKSFQADPNARFTKIQGQTVIELTEAPVKAKGGPVKGKAEVKGKVGVKGPPKKVAERPKGPDAPPTAICVANGYLLVATQIGLMEKVLTSKERPLADDPGYKLITKELSQFAKDGPAFQAFSRTADDVEPTYELFRAGKLRDDQSLFGQVLRDAIGEERMQKVSVSGQKLPPFAIVRRYLGPSGWFASSEDDGWFVSGFTRSLSDD